MESPDPARIVLRDLHYQVDGQSILCGIDLTVTPGEIVCIMGLSGAGKSTILRCIAGLVPATKGEICIDGVNLVGLKERELLPIRAKMGVVFQYAALFDSMNVYENIAFGLLRGPRRQEFRKQPRTVIAQRVASHLAEVGLAGIEKRLPMELSGGMRRRVGLARALATEPETVLYDEPTSGLDPVTAAAIDDLIVHTRDSKGVTSIVVSHDMRSIFHIADRILMLYDGKVQIYGTPEELKTSEDPVVQQFIRGETQGPIQPRRQ